MTYASHADCSCNATLSRLLISKGCEPLCRRRCLSRRPLDHRPWITAPRHVHEFLVDEALRLSTSRIQIGFHVASGANFGAWMRESRVTVWGSG